VVALPTTHAPRDDPGHPVEIPLATKRRLGLDEARSWIVIAEANRFEWPGPDPRPMRSDDGSTIVYGELPGALFRERKNTYRGRDAP
jgi:hypothetical protein